MNAIQQYDVTVLKGRSLFGNTYDLHSLSNCFFHNISNYHASSPLSNFEHQQTTMIIGCQLSNIMNGLTGTLTCDLNHNEKFLGTNMTIFCNEATYAEEVSNTQGQHFDSDMVVKDTLFKNCYSDGHGGGVAFEGDGTFEVDNCKFVECTCPTKGSHGGAVCYLPLASTTSASFQLSNTIMERCSSGHVGGGFGVGVYKQNSYNVLATITNVEVISCSAGKSAGGAFFQFLFGATVQNLVINECYAPLSLGFVQNGALGKHTYQSLSITETEAVNSFKDPDTQIDSESLLFLYAHRNEVSFDSVRILTEQSFSAAAISINQAWDADFPAPDKENILLYPYATFSDLFIEKGEKATIGPAFFIHSQWDPYFIDGFDPNEMLSKTQQSYTTSSQPSLLTGSEDRKTWLVSNEIHMNNQTGTEEAFCWVPKSTCKSFRDLIPRTGLQFEGTVLVEDGKFSEEDINIGARTMSITGESKTGSILTDSGSTTALLIVSTGSLSLSVITLAAHHNSPLISSEGTISLTDIVIYCSASPRQSSLVIVKKKGSVRASSFSVSSVSFTSGHIFDLTDSDLELSNMQFSSISGSSDGSVFSSSTSGKISLSSVQFSGCSCGTEKKGRSFYFHRTYFKSSEILLNDVTFINPTTKGEREVFISSVSAGGHVKPAWSSFIPPVPTSSDGLYKQFWLENTNDPKFSGPMVFYLYPHMNGTVHVSGKSLDHPVCGEENAPCLTIKGGMEKMKDKKEVVMDTNIELSTKLTSTAIVWSLQRESNQVLTISKLGSFVTSVTGAELTLSSLLIHFQETTETSFLTASHGKITLSSCTLGDGSTAIPMTIGTVTDDGSLILTGANSLKLVSSVQPLFVVNGGILEVQAGISLTYPTTQTSSLFKLSGGSTSITGTEADPIIMSTVTFTSEDSLIKMSGDASLIITHSQCTSITSAGSGSVIHSTSSGTIRLDHVVFSGNKCGSTMKGRSIFIERTFSSSCLIMTTVTFPTRTKQGHHEIFLKGEDINSTVTNDWKSFIGEENTQTAATMEEFWGEDTTGSRLTGPLAYHLFKYLTGRKEVDVSFWDHPFCGQPTLPCKTLDNTFSTLNESNQELFVASDLDLTSKLDAHAEGSLILSSSTLPKTISLSATAQFSVPVSTSIHLKYLKFLLSSSISKTIFDVTGGDLQLTNVKISTKASTSNDQFLFVCPLISISNGGKAALQSSSISDVSLSTDPIIVHSSGSLSIVSTTFSSIVRQNGNGSVLVSAMDTTMKLVLNDVTLQNVQSLNGAADGMFISFATNPLIEDNSVFMLENIKDSPSLSSNSDEPNFIWLEGPSLDSSIVVSDSRFTGSFNDSTKEEWLWSVNTATTFSASLLFYLLPHDGPVGVADGGVDMLRCGYSSVWCESLPYSMSRAVTMKTEQINVMKKLTVLDRVDLTHDLNLVGKPTGAEVILGADGCFSEETGDTVHFSSLEIVLETSTRTGPAFVVNLGHMNLSLIEISVKSEQTMPIFKNQDSTLTLQSITLSSTSHSLPRLVECSGGKLTINTFSSKGHAFSSTPIFLSSLKSAALERVFISTKSKQTLLEVSDTPDMQLLSSTFEGLDDPARMSNEEDLCDWSNGAVHLVNTVASVDNTRFTSLSQGALSTSNSTTTIHSSTFETNFGGNTSFPSFSRNIHCSNGKIVVNSVNGGDGSKDLPSAWITQSEECQFESSLITSEAVLFIPTLDTETSKASLNKKTGLFSITVCGSLLIPCGLKMEAYSVNDNQIKNTKLIDLSASPTATWNETALSLTLTKSLLTALGEDLEWRLRLVFGKDHRTNQSILLKLSTSDERKSQFAAIRNWLIPLIIGVSVLLVLFIVIVIICCRRRQQQKGKENEMKPMIGEMEEGVDQLKVEVTDTFPVDVDTTANLVKANQNEFDRVNELNETANHLNEGRAPAAVMKPIEVMCCSSPFTTTITTPYQTLYHRLHGQKEGMNASEKRRIAREVVKLLRHVSLHNSQCGAMKKLSPHSLLFGPENEIMLKMKEGGTEAVGTKEATSEVGTGGGGVNDLRWMAPEVYKKKENTQTDHGAVFSLGLILWELETGLVPFGETDAANAQRQLGIGVAPPMNKVGNNLSLLISQCLALDETKRPTLADINEALKEDKMFTTTQEELAQPM
ncbi:hypothetical protein BLNAU_22520 [Blattamonas nauphoetae]|uniref:Protein kinase domain-containing protein n=1 Tax=Blattamonas nauphoetae TaxID=2049346 RepID=A0ABQ9WV16_9EUKA|nr:hypothetical protein BLNAU_22520 [Blattamonas nauphoetae]